MNIYYNLCLSIVQVIFFLHLNLVCIGFNNSDSICSLSLLLKIVSRPDQNILFIYSSIFRVNAFFFPQQSVTACDCRLKIAALLVLVLCNNELPLHPNESVATFGSSHDSGDSVSNVINSGFMASALHSAEVTYKVADTGKNQL